MGECPVGKPEHPPASARLGVWRVEIRGKVECTEDASTSEYGYGGTGAT